MHPFILSLENLFLAFRALENPLAECGGCPQLKGHLALCIVDTSVSVLLIEMSCSLHFRIRGCPLYVGPD